MAQTVMNEATVNRIRNATYVFADTDQKNLDELTKKGYNIVSLIDTSITPQFFKGITNLYILTGLGRTGARNTYTAAVAAKEGGVPSPNIIVTIPFKFEGKETLARALDTVGKLNGFPTVVLSNDDLLDKFPDMKMSDAFKYVDRVVLKTIESSEK